MSSEVWGFGSVQRHPEWKNNHNELRSLSASPMMVGQGVDVFVGDEPEHFDTNTLPTSSLGLANTLLSVGVLTCLLVIVYRRLAKTRRGVTNEPLLRELH